MGSKKYKNKTCVYCGTEGLTTGPDHVFAREFFLEERREDLPKVPSCEQCNNSKSRLEHYLTSVLPFGGKHNDARKNLSEMVPKRLEKNKKLHRELTEGKGTVYTKRLSGISTPYMTVPIDVNQLLKLFKYITRALAHIHFDVNLDTNDLVDSSVDLKNIDSWLNGPCANRIQCDLGANTISYTGVQALDSAKVTAWEFCFYGGIALSNRKETKIITFTGPAHIKETVKTRAKINI